MVHYGHVMTRVLTCHLCPVNTHQLIHQCGESIVVGLEARGEMSELFRERPEGSTTSTTSSTTGSAATTIVLTMITAAVVVIIGVIHFVSIMDTTK